MPTRPFVLINMAVTADGKIATANRSVASFGSRRDLANLYALRATVDAVMAGARTVDGERVDLGPGPLRFRRLRVSRGLAESNLRVVVSGTASVDPNAVIFRRRFSPVIILTSARAPATRRRRLEAQADAVASFGRHEVDLTAALAWLRQHWGVRRMLCEGGGELNAAMLRAGLVDELHITVCPTIAGGHLAPTLADGPAADTLAQAIACRLKRARRRGGELFLVYDVLPGRSRG